MVVEFCVEIVFNFDVNMINIKYSVVLMRFCINVVDISVLVMYIVNL